MRASYCDGQVGCIMRSILVDDFGNNSCVVEREWCMVDGAYFEDCHHTQYCVSHETMEWLYRPLPRDDE
jgi:hypothetical protein